MKCLKILKNEKLIAFIGGVAAATVGVKALRSETVRNAAVKTLAQGMKLQKDAKSTFETMKEDAEDICSEAKASLDEEE